MDSAADWILLKLSWTNICVEYVYVNIWYPEFTTETMDLKFGSFLALWLLKLKPKLPVNTSS